MAMLDLSFAAQSSALGAHRPTSTLGNVMWRISSAPARCDSSATMTEIAARIAKSVRLIVCSDLNMSCFDRSSSNEFLGLVVVLAVAAQRCGFCAGIKLLEPGGDLGILALEQRITDEIALDQERAELFHVKHPHGLRQAKLLQPINAGDALDAAAEQRAGAVADRGQIDRVVRHEMLAIGRRRHAAFADDDVAAGDFKPAAEPLRKTKRRRRGDRADGVAAVGIDRRGWRAMKIGDAD